METPAHPDPEPQDDAGQPGTAGPEPQDVPVLRVGYEVGMMPGKWFRRWRERTHEEGLEERQLAPGRWPQALGEAVDVALVRLAPHPRPDGDLALADLTRVRESLHAVELYEEQQVVVLPVDEELTLLDDVPIAELADEWLLQDLDQLPEHRPSTEGRGTDDSGEPRELPEIADSGAAVELVAAGAGLLVTPMSVARWHHRKDLTYRPIPDLPLVPVVLVWPRDLPERTEAMVQDFLGIVRGRREGTSRSSETGPSAEQDGLPAGHAPEARRAAGSARRRGSATKSGGGSARTGKGTSRGDQLAGKRLAGGKPRRSGGGRPGGRPKGRGGRPGRGR